MTRFADVAALVDNPLSYADGRPFAAILGANPSKGARSPALWNAAFAAHGLDAEMLPLDAPADRLATLLAVLDGNRAFIGGAVAVPHKDAVARWLGDRVSEDVAAIGAVNCLLRDSDGRLAGANTDGEGALVPFERRFGSVAGKSVLVLGAGGVGKAVAATFRRAVAPAGRLTIAGRSTAARTYAEGVDANWVEWTDVAAAVATADVVINCTTVGSRTMPGESPLSASLLAAAARRPIVFDVIYDPSPSALLASARGHGLAVMDGADMNLEQAVLAFSYAVRGGGRETTRRAMEEASQPLRARLSLT